MRKHLIEKLIQRAHIDERVFLMIGDLGFSVVEAFRDSFPDRFLNAGISEQAAVGMAAGLAKTHLPIFYSIANFPSFRCLEQIRNDVAHEGHPVLIVSLGAGFSYGTAGYSHHAIEDAAAVASIFGMAVFTPACVHELDDFLESHWEDPRPTYLRLGSSELCDSCIDTPDELLALSEALQNHNQDSIVISHGEIGKSVRVALEQSASHATHISISNFKVSDPAILKYISGFRNVLTVEEHSRECGFGASLRAKLSNVRFDCFQIEGVPSLDFHIGGKRDFHLERAGLAVNQIAEKIKSIKGFGHG